MLFFNLSTLWQAFRESEQQGLYHLELLKLFAENGSKAFGSLCITSSSYWFCVENAYQSTTFLHPGSIFSQ